MSNQIETDAILSALDAIRKLEKKIDRVEKFITKDLYMWGTDSEVSHILEKDTFTNVIKDTVKHTLYISLNSPEIKDQ